MFTKITTFMAACLGAASAKKLPIGLDNSTSGTPSAPESHYAVCAIDNFDQKYWIGMRQVRGDTPEIFFRGYEYYEGAPPSSTTELTSIHIVLTYNGKVVDGDDRLELGEERINEVDGVSIYTYKFKKDMVLNEVWYPNFDISNPGSLGIYNEQTREFYACDYTYSTAKEATCHPKPLADLRAHKKCFSKVWSAYEDCTEFSDVCSTGSTPSESP